MYLNHWDYNIFNKKHTLQYAWIYWENLSMRCPSIRRRTHKKKKKNNTFTSKDNAGFLNDLMFYLPLSFYTRKTLCPVFRDLVYPFFSTILEPSRKTIWSECKLYCNQNVVSLLCFHLWLFVKKIISIQSTFTSKLYLAKAIYLLR